MPERDGHIPGVPCWVDTSQPDPEAAVGFYGDLFGWAFDDQMPADAPGRYFVARLRSRDVAGVGSRPDEGPPTAMWNTYIWVDSADDTAAGVRDEGGTVLTAPFDVYDAGRMAVCSDPSGAAFCVWQANQHKGAQVVNEPGTWNWSDLNTRDPAGAKAFYGAVFGWEADPLDLGFGESWMWRVPGYGDFLETFDPEIRRRQGDAGAPTGFEDAIGWMMRMTSDQFSDDVPSHWSVTFAVDDADAVATRAAELGGTVIVDPYDAVFARVAVLNDPHGAVFTISKYSPPA
ncbi:MAG: VOC family protein [Acidimicrobiales bacterium]